MENETISEAREQLQDSLNKVSTSLMNNDELSVMRLSKIAEIFLYSFLATLDDNLKQKKEKFFFTESEVKFGPKERKKMNQRDILFKEYIRKDRNLIKNILPPTATPIEKIINTNSISDTLEQMNFPHFIGTIQKKSIEINERARSQSFAAVYKLPFVSKNTHFDVINELIEKGEEVDLGLLARTKKAEKEMNKPKRRKKRLPRARRKDGWFF